MTFQIFKITRAPEARPITSAQLRSMLWRNLDRSDSEWEVEEITETKQEDSKLWLDLTPELSGWYWWKSVNQPQAVCLSIYIKENEKKQWFAIERDSGKDASSWGGQWCGPITPPATII
jgi:hypothetical protein